MPFTILQEAGTQCKKRHIARSMGLKMNEYGLFRILTASAFHAANGSCLVPSVCLYCPELREDMGEVEAALEGRLPRLVESSDLQFHLHTNYSDGHNTIRNWQKRYEQGYKYTSLDAASPPITWRAEGRGHYQAA